MRRLAVCTVFVTLLALLSTMSASAQDGEATVYYVRLGPEAGCEDGSQECPYSTFHKAISTGREDVCEGRTFEIYLWDDAFSAYEYYDTYAGGRPLLPTGLPIAPSVQIALVALGGLLLVILGLIVRRRSAKKASGSIQGNTS